MWDQMDRGRRPGPAGARDATRGRTPPDRADSAANAGEGADERDGDAARLDGAESVEAARLLDELAADDAAYAALAGGVVEDAQTATPLTGALRRAQMRAMIREFLRAVPRSEAETILRLPRPDGETRVLTRADLTAAIDHLRPRMRQIVRLGIEERWPRQKVCAYLRGISMKTLERDQVEALDLLASL